MFDFDYARQALDRDSDDIDFRVSSFNQEVESASDRFAWQVAGVAVNKIPYPAVRRRMTRLVAQKVASGVSTSERSGDDAVFSAKDAWMRFATVFRDNSHSPRTYSGNKPAGKLAIIPVSVFSANANAVEALDAADIAGSNSDETLQMRQYEDMSAENVAFIASPHLISAWLDGLNATRAEGGHEALLPVSSETQEHYAAELIRQLRKVISNFAKRKAYEGGAYRITFASAFLPSIEGLIEDHLMLPPRNAVVFLDIFKDELYRQSAAQAVFKGRWGELRVDDVGELSLILQKRRSRNLKSILKGK